MAKKAKKKAAKKKPALKKKLPNKKKSTTKKSLQKKKELLIARYDIFCFKEKKFIARNKTLEQAAFITSNHPHPTELQQTQSG